MFVKVRFSGFTRVNETYEKLMWHWNRFAILLVGGRKGGTRSYTYFNSRCKDEESQMTERKPFLYDLPAHKNSNSFLGVLFITIIEAKQLPRNFRGTYLPTRINASALTKRFLLLYTTKNFFFCFLFLWVC